MTSEADKALALQYELRFGKLQDYRLKVWTELCKAFFQPLIGKQDAILDLGCGWGEFINTIRAGKKFAMDLNPESPNHLQPDIAFIHQDCSEPWAVQAHSLDVVFTSNFFEHLPSKEKLLLTVKEVYRCLKPGGRMICMGPNIKYLSGAYWEFFDHHIPLSDASVEELTRICGFREITVIKKFLPYTMAERVQPPIFLLRFYLKMPIL
ncbi:MAG: class I SAM-dependent methyltransferase, partial [Verrucomicrobia bacterium]|nr:class I SAM-dependent methyltransferase [Verrucomicrobiota bacterium]